MKRKYVGSGVYECGKSGAKMRATSPGRNQGRKYACSAHPCVMRSGEPLDDLVENAVVERLSAPDAHLLIDHGEVGIKDLQTQRAALVAKYDELATLFRDGVLDGPGVRDVSADLKAKIGEIDGKLAKAASTSPTAALLASGKQLRKRWAKLTPTVRSQIIDEVAVVTVNPYKRRGVRKFDPDYVDVKFRDHAQ